MNLNYRLLRRDELFKLKKLYRKEGWLKNPNELLTAAVAELPDGMIVGTAGFELFPHIGHGVVLEQFRGNGIIEQCITTIEDLLDKKPGTSWITLASNEAAINVVKKLGLEKLPLEVWKREYK